MVRLILRWLDAEDRILAWTEIGAHMRGDGALSATGPITAAGEADGEAVCLHLHWPDLHAQARIAIRESIRLGTLVSVMFPHGEVWRFDNPRDHPPIPPVTVRGPVLARVDTGGLGLS